jgi:hypothetical protein
MDEKNNLLIVLKNFCQAIGAKLNLNEIVCKSINRHEVVVFLLVALKLPSDLETYWPWWSKLGVPVTALFATRDQTLEKFYSWLIAITQYLSYFLPSLLNLIGNKNVANVNILPFIRCFQISFFFRQIPFTFFIFNLKLIKVLCSVIDYPQFVPLVPPSLTHRLSLANHICWCEGGGTIVGGACGIADWWIVLFS